MSDVRPPLPEGTDHPELHDVGAYVLGALREPERSAVTRHLETCGVCQAELTRLAPLPHLLALVPADVAAQLADDEWPADGVPGTAAAARARAAAADVPPSVLEGALRRAQWEELPRRRRVVVAVAAAAVLVLGVVVGAQVLDLRDDGAGPPTAEPTAAPGTTTVALEPVASAPVTASVELEPVAWGTRLTLTCTYDPGGYATGVEYALVVRDSRGRTERVGTWIAEPGATVTVPGATSTPVAQIAAVEMVTPDGVAVLRATVGDGP